jgi:hypothetical protein
MRRIRDVVNEARAATRLDRAYARAKEKTLERGNKRAEQARDVTPQQGPKNTPKREPEL